MTPNDAMSEPLDGYENYYKQLHLDNTRKLFDDLVKKSGVDTAANKRTVTEYKKKMSEVARLNSSLSKYRFLRALLIIASIISVVAAVALFVAAFNSDSKMALKIIIACACIVIFVVSLVLIFAKCNPAIKQTEQLKKKREREGKTLENKAWSQMAPLNALYDWDIPQKLIEKTVPEIQMDENFDELKFTCFRERYNFTPTEDETSSTQFCQTGSVGGNPFAIVRDLRQGWRQRIYSGSLVITWTTTVHTKDGTRTVHHSQVLTASVSRSEPTYREDTYLIYGNEAAPNLIFSRKPSGVSGMDSDDIEKKVAKKVKKLDKKARKAVMQGKDYTRMGNDEFEVLFGGTDRNDEVEYRMMFTPLARKNLLKLIETPKPYGDDFTIQKIQKINFLRSAHSQSFDYEVNPIKFTHFDYEAAKENFINTNTEYFKSLYFDLAPFMSIPLYQQQKSGEFKAEHPCESNLCRYEHESIANSFNSNFLRPRGSATPSIIKTRFVKKCGAADEVMVTAHAYRAERRISYIPEFGGDGRTHSVPVVWLEYIPIDNTTRMAVQKKSSSRMQINFSSSKNANDILKMHSGSAWLYERGLFAMLTDNPLTSEIVEGIEKLNGENEVAAAVSEADAEDLAMLIRAEAERRDKANVPDTDAEQLLEDDNAQTEEVDIDDGECQLGDIDDDFDDEI